MVDSKRNLNQISFRVDDELNDQMAKAADVEELAVADFVRKVFKWAFAEYQKAGSLYTLRQHIVARQVKIERKVYERIKSKPKPQPK